MFLVAPCAGRAWRQVVLADADSGYGVVCHVPMPHLDVSDEPFSPGGDLPLIRVAYRRHGDAAVAAERCIADLGLAPESEYGNRSAALLLLGGKLGLDADASGLLELPADATDEQVEQLVWQQLRTCFDPEIPVNIVELGLVYEVEIKHLDEGKREIDVKMTLTAPGCGMGEILVDDVRSKLEMIPTVAEADVDLVFDPPWNQHMMSEAARLETGML